ncbi:SH3 domain-containing protein [Metabacillus litoralis]|uniref:SH3 domain-containing protein n=1 Tax=Metabacillus litoralis TaxID=152268 RepID=UPI001BA15498|nr:SH3 domain-containing protein [Metabacillus litoralis]UHA61556.1 SH3 domain-containing protein [Metabacillus litoralis]
MKWFRTLIAVTFLFLSIGQPYSTYAAESSEPYPFIGQVTGDTVSMHKGATTNYDVVSTLKKGEIVGVIGDFTNNSNEEWLNISVNSVKGWVKKTSVSPLEEAPSSLYANKNLADVRKGASTSYPSVETLQYGQKVTVIDTYVSTQGEIWYRIDLGSVQGWVYSEQLTKTPVVQLLQTNQFATVHSGATSSYKIVTTLEENVELTIIDSFTNNQQEVWYRIQLEDGTKGWVHSEFTEVIQENNDTTQSFPIVYVKNVGSKIHSGALDSYRVVYLPNQNEALQVIDEFTNNLNQTWYRVELSADLKGWILSTEVQEQPLHESQIVGNYVFVKNDGAVVRKGALSSYPTADTLTVNDDLKVIGTFINQNDEFWLRVQTSNNVTGWILATDTQKETKVNTTYYLNTNGVVRSGALDSYRQLASLSQGSAVYVIDTFENNNKELWYRVTLESGENGWVKSTAVTSKQIYLNKSFVVGTNSTYVYKGAMHHYKKVTKLPYGSKVKVLFEFINDKNQHWYNVQLSNGTKGWVPKAELFTSLSDRTFVYPLNANVLHKSATASSGYNTKVQAGEQLIFLWSHNEWINVENSKGVRGWILKNDTREFIPNIFLNPKVSQSGNATTLVWDKSLNFAVGNKLLSNGVVQLTGSKLHTVLPSQSIKGLKNISATSSAITLTPESGYMIEVRNNSKQTQVKVMPIGLAGKKIIVDAGHGDQDPGAVGPTKLKEKDVTLDVSRKLKAELERQGAIVTLTRSGDSFLTLAQRVAIANSSDNDAFISIHANASVSTSARGTETYYNTAYNFNGPKSSVLASYIQDSLVDRINTYDRGTKTANYYVLKNNELPSALVELAFISNPNEESMLKNDITRGQAAVGIAEGLKKYFTGGN